MKQFKNVFETVMKFAVVQPTSANCEKTFSLVGQFVQAMPNSYVQTIGNRVALRIGMKSSNLKEILFDWLPKEEKMKRKSS